MRWTIGFTFAAFLTIMAAAWIASERASPVFVNVDAAAGSAPRR